MPPILKMTPEEKIQKTALELFFKYGIKHVTMDDIAKELGMSKKTIYQYYSVKDELVNHLTDVELKKQTSKFEEIKKEAKDPIHEIVLISEKMRDMMQNINPVFFLDLQKLYPKAYEKFKEFRNNHAQKEINANIKAGKAAGVYREDISEELVARYRMAQIDMLMFSDYFSFERIGFIKANEFLLDMFIYGICTVKGHKLINNYKKIKEEEH